MSDTELLCFHGSPGSPQDFALLSESLSDSFNVIAPGRHGYPWQTQPNLRTESDAKQVWLGYSWGAAEALIESARTNRPLAGMILVSPYLFPKNTSALKNALIRTPILGNLLLAKMGAKAIDEMLAKSSAPQAVPEAYRACGEQLKHPEVMRASMLEKSTKSGLISTALQSLRDRRIPVLVVWSKKDQTSLEAEQIAPIRKEISTLSEKRFEDAGHAIPWTHPEELATTVEEFITTLKEVP